MPTGVSDYSECVRTGTHNNNITRERQFLSFSFSLHSSKNPFYTDAYTNIGLPKYTDQVTFFSPLSSFIFIIIIILFTRVLSTFHRFLRHFFRCAHRLADCIPIRLYVKSVKAQIIR